MNRSIETRKSSISSTEERLSDALHQISQLPSFSTEQQSTTPTTPPASSLNADTSLGLGLSGEEQAALRYANHVFARHISLLKEYNNIKDVAMGMLSILAEQQGRRLTEVMKEYGLNEED